MKGPRLNQDLLKVPVYIAGKSIDVVKEELGLEKVTKMASNESPVGPSPMGVKAAQEMLPQAHRYPGLVARTLRRKLAARLEGIDASQILLGNGGSDILRMITQAFVFDGGNTIMSRVTFPLYRILTTAYGGEPRQIPARSHDHGHDLEAMLAAIDEDTRIVYLCSPNNPTGQVITSAETESFMAQVPDHVVVIFDEPYRDFVTDPDFADSLSFVRRHLNVILAGSFSKNAGLANLRAGFLVGPEHLVEYLRHVQLPFQVGDIALAAANASLDDVNYHKQSREAVWNGRDYLYTQLCQLGLNCLPTQANFLTVVDPPLAASALTEALLHQGFIVRPMTPFGLPNAIRISVGNMAENEAFINVLSGILENQKIAEATV